MGAAAVSPLSISYEVAGARRRRTFSIDRARGFNTLPKLRVGWDPGRARPAARLAAGGAAGRRRHRPTSSSATFPPSPSLAGWPACSQGRAGSVTPAPTSMLPPRRSRNSPDRGPPAAAPPRGPASGHRPGTPTHSRGSAVVTSQPTSAPRPGPGHTNSTSSLRPAAAASAPTRPASARTTSPA